MRLIIIGASGLIGNNLYAAARTAGREVIGTYHTVRKDGLVHYDMKSESLRSIVPDLTPRDVVYLLAAYSNPSWIYENQAPSRALNLLATKRVIDEVFEAGARLVFMSSVEVFDGKHGNYNEESVPRPLNLYGQMKFEIEDYLAKREGQSCVVRTGWNVGWTLQHRCVVKLTYETLMRPGARMAKDNTFSISDVRDTAEGLLRISENDSLRICHLASTPYIVRTDLASLIQSFSKYKDMMAYEVVSFSDIPYSEPRGQYNHLDNTLALSSLGMNFKPPEEIIRRKVKLLDLEIADMEFDMKKFRFMDSQRFRYNDGKMVDSGKNGRGYL